MAKILILFAHPALHRSRVHKPMLEAVRGLDSVTIRDLYELYPDFHVSEPAERELLDSHDVIVFQHPLYWYSCPALLTEWIDLVLSPAWALDPGGRRLENKILFSAITAGLGGELYADSDYDRRYPISYFLLPFEQIAHRCGMNYIQPHVVKNVGTATDQEISAHVERYRELILALRDDVALPAFDSQLTPRF